MADPLAPLLADGVIEAVISRLKSGKEADIYLVEHGGEVVAAKVYKAREARNFRNNAAYKEGRQVRNSRTQRAMDKGSKFGLEASEDAWKQTESDALAQLHAAGVRVPQPVMFYEGVLLMELVIDATGHPAPRLIDAHIPLDVARPFYEDLRRQVIKMLTCHMIHGDLSPYNVMLAWNGPTIIDFPQVVGASHNSQAAWFFERDLGTIQKFFAAIDPSLNANALDAKEIWRAYERAELTDDFVPTGRFVDSKPRREWRNDRGPRADAPREDRGPRQQQPRDGRPQRGPKVDVHGAPNVHGGGPQQQNGQRRSDRRDGRPPRDEGRPRNDTGQRPQQTSNGPQQHSQHGAENSGEQSRQQQHARASQPNQGQRQSAPREQEGAGGSQGREPGQRRDGQRQQDARGSQGRDQRQRQNGPRQQQDARGAQGHDQGQRQDGPRQQRQDSPQAAQEQQGPRIADPNGTQNSQRPPRQDGPRQQNGQRRRDGGRTDGGGRGQNTQQANPPSGNRQSPPQQGRPGGAQSGREQPTQGGTARTQQTRAGGPNNAQRAQQPGGPDRRNNNGPQVSYVARSSGPEVSYASRPSEPRQQHPEAALPSGTRHK